MAQNTKIEWCDHTWNPWIGCTEVSPACDFCYARELSSRYGWAAWGAGQPRHRTSEATWKTPFTWNRAAERAGEKATVFCLSLGDIWDNEVDPAWRRDAFKVMDATPNLIYLLLSKRIGNAVRMCEALSRALPRNAALGATMVNQPEWERDALKLKAAGATLGAQFTFASVEPMLSLVIMEDFCPDWVICGGESGRSPRYMEEEWAAMLRSQTQARGKAFFMKQMTGKKPIPADLLVREFPVAA